MTDTRASLHSFSPPRRGREGRKEEGRQRRIKWESRSTAGGGFGNRGGNYCQAPVVYFHSRCALEEKEEEEEEKKVFLQPCVSFRKKKGKGTKGRKNNCSVVTALFTSPTEMRSKYGSNYSFTWAVNHSFLFPVFPLVVLRLIKSPILGY